MCSLGKGYPEAAEIAIEGIPMARYYTIIDLIEDAVGNSPSEIVSCGRRLTKEDLVSIIMAREVVLEEIAVNKISSQEIWPLMSHHNYSGRALLGSGSKDILPRTLALLLIHDGIVIADPLETLHQLLAARGYERALSFLNVIMEEVAQIEPLITSGVLRLTSLRPPLREVHRSTVLNVLGIDPDLGVFTNLVEQAAFIPESQKAAESICAFEIQKMYQGFGFKVGRPDTRAKAIKYVERLAAAVIEVSWQFAVAALDPSCDLAFSGKIEQHIAERLLTIGLEASLGPGRHVATFELGLVPNLDTRRLTIPDVLALRREDSFEAFRHGLRKALDRLNLSKEVGEMASSARSAFEEAMREESRILRETAKRATFRDILKNSALPAALGVAAPFITAPYGPMAAAGAESIISLATIIWQWYVARRDQKNQVMTQRYFSMLGGNNF